MFKNIIFLLPLLFTVAFCKPQEDLVNLATTPGFNQFKDYKSEIYSGYLKVDEHKAHHYFFLESKSNPSKDPLVLWLNGGPGCSSLLGFLYEHGPFIFPDGTDKLVSNQYTWNAKANVIYMESPACVGYSYCDDKKMPFNDEITAQDNLDAFIAFLAKFPEYANHPLYISGESYAGVYVPFLSYWIDQHNEKVLKGLNAGPKINLIGFAVGNPVTHPKFDDYSVLPFWARHAGLSQKDQDEVKKFCGNDKSFDEKKCTALARRLYKALEDVNIYDFYRYCYNNATSHGSQYFTTFKTLYNENYGTFKSFNVFDDPDVGVPPCVDDFGAFKWLNDPVVRKSLHIWDNAPKTWYMCSNIKYTPNEKASYWIYPHMIKKGYRILVFSGDSDGAVPVDGTIQWIDQLKTDINMKLLKPHAPWYLPGNVPNEPQVQGYWRKYDGLTFATVMGVGHMVPQWNRPAAFKLFYDYLDNKDLS